jgi:hypothetical protein
MTVVIISHTIIRITAGLIRRCRFRLDSAAVITVVDLTEADTVAVDSTAVFVVEKLVS